MTPIIKPEKNKKIIVIGTRKHANDLHQELLENEQYETRVYKAIDENEQPLWKEKFNLEKLLKIKNEIGSTIFAQEYQNEPVDDTNSLFRREWIKNCKNEKMTFINMLQRKNERRRNILVITGWDLSIVMDKERAERSDTDYTVGITILYDKELKTRRIINMYRERGITPSELLAKVEEINYRYDEDMIIIENNLFQILYSYQLLVTTDLPIIGHTTTQKDKINIYEGIPAMSILFENKKYILPVKEKEDIRMIKILEDELVGLGYEDHDDTLMALWFIECGISKYKEIEMNLEIIDDPTI